MRTETQQIERSRRLSVAFNGQTVESTDPITGETRRILRPPIDERHAEIRHEIFALEDEFARRDPTEPWPISQERAMSLAYLGKRHEHYPMLPFETQFKYDAERFGWAPERFRRWASAREWQ